LKAAPYSCPISSPTMHTPMSLCWQSN
jgi:hypothetical protein